MMTKEASAEAYTVDKLPEDIKQWVLDKYRHLEVEDFDWWDCVYDDWKEKLQEFGFMEPEIYFSGFGSQGDGACFDCKHIDIRKFASHHKETFIKLFFPHINKHLDAIENCVDFRIERNSYANHYSHRNTRYVDWQIHTDVDEELGERLAATFEEKIKEISGLIDDVRTELSDKIYKSLWDEYDYLTSDEAVIEALNSNDYKFDEEGERCDP